MISGYRDVWSSGDSGERICVQHFILDRRDPEGFDVIVDGLNCADERVAADAAAITSALVMEGYYVGPNIRRELELFGERFPDWDDISTAVLRILAKTEN